MSTSAVLLNEKQQAGKSPAHDSAAAHRLPAQRTTPMKVVHLIKHCGHANGSVHVAVDLACVQARAGYEVTFVSGGGTFVPLLEQFGVRHVTLPHEQGKPLSVLRAAWRVTRLARRTKPDVLHAHMMSSAVVGFVVSKLSGVPLVTTVHNSFDKHSFIMRLGRKVVAVSQEECKQLRLRGYREDQLVSVLNAPNHSPREEFMQNAREIDVVSPCIVAANALHRRKGVFDLIEVCAKLFQEIPEWRLYIAGEGPDREKLEEQAAAAGIAHRTTFLGFLPAPRPLLEQADIFVLASYADPCSLAVGEARAAGCAIVATSVGGTPEMLDFGRAGRLFSPGDQAQLERELRTLMVNPAERANLKAASLKDSHIFDVRRLVEDYARVYRDARRSGAERA